MQEVQYCQRCGSAMRLQVWQGRERPVCAACGAVFFSDPKVVAGVIIPLDSKVVMIRRNNEPGLGKWTIPAGFVDRGEVVEEAAMREVWEETGLRVELTRLVGLYSKSGDANILVVYEGHVVGGSLQAGDEAQEAGLFDLNALPPLAFQRDEGILRQWRSGNAQ